MKAAATSSTFIPMPRSAAPEALSPQTLSPVADRNAPEGRSPKAIRLTPRQLEVLALLCEGLPNKLICRHLDISAGTVKAHISGILRELGVSSRLQAVVAARGSGLLREVAKVEGANPHQATRQRVAAGTVTSVDFGQRPNQRLSLTQQGR